MTQEELILISDVAKNIKISDVPKEHQINFMMLVMDGEKLKSERQSKIQEIQNKVISDKNIDANELQSRMDNKTLNNDDEECISEINSLINELFSLYSKTEYENKYIINTESVLDICSNSGLKVHEVIIMTKMAE